MTPVARWVLFTAIVGVIGAATSRWFVLPAVRWHETEIDRDWLLARTGTFGLTASLGGLAGLGLLFSGQLMAFRDPFSPWLAEARLLLLGTAWGRSWIAVLGATVLASLAFHVARKGRGWAWIAVAGLAALIGLYPAMAGHAIASDRLRTLAVVGDAMHVWAAGSWIGGLGLLLFLELSWRRRNGGSSLLPQMVPAFSRVAVVSVATLALTGLFSAWLHLPTVGALFTSTYGRLLLGKLVVVGMILALGAWNWRRLTPVLSDPSGPDRLRRAASYELLLGQVALAITAVFVGSAPP